MGAGFGGHLKSRRCMPFAALAPAVEDDALNKRGMNGANVISMGGANVIAMGGGNVISGGANVISMGGANLISPGAQDWAKNGLTHPGGAR